MTTRYTDTDTVQQGSPCQMRTGGWMVKVTEACNHCSSASWDQGQSYETPASRLQKSVDDFASPLDRRPRYGSAASATSR